MANKRHRTKPSFVVGWLGSDGYVFSCRAGSIDERPRKEWVLLVNKGRISILKAGEALIVEQSVLGAPLVVNSEMAYVPN